MRKTALFVLALSAALLLVVHLLGGRQEAIARAQAAASHLQLERDSLAGEVRRRETEQAALERERVTQEVAARRLRDSVTALERRRAEEQLGVRNIRTIGVLQHRLRNAFPELGERGWGLTTLPLDGDSLGVEYLMIPAWFAETFIIDHANAASWRAQKDRLLAVDSLRLQVTALQDSVTRLVAANAGAYDLGYQAALNRYQDLTDQYVAELKKPRFRLPSGLALVGAAGLGLVIGGVLHD